jgi:hypothetical protein
VGNRWEIKPKTEKGTQPIKLNPLLLLARLAGFEPATYGFVVRAFEFHTNSSTNGNRSYSPEFIFQIKGDFPDFG